MKDFVVLIDDDKDVRVFMKEILKDEIDLKFESFESVKSFMCSEIPPTIKIYLLLDIYMTNENGLEEIKNILNSYHNIEITMFSSSEDYSSLIESFKNGAVGYILKTFDTKEMKSSIDILRNGGAFLSPKMAKKLIQGFTRKKINNSSKKLTEKEFELLELLSKGNSYQEISEIIGISINGVRARVKRIYRKLHVNNKASAIQYYFNLR